MAGNRKSRKGKASEVKSSDGFQDRLFGMLEWLADKDPVRAAKLVGQYLDELASELGQPVKPVKS